MQYLNLQQGSINIQVHLTSSSAVLFKASDRVRRRCCFFTSMTRFSLRKGWISREFLPEVFQSHIYRRVSLARPIAASSYLWLRGGRSVRRWTAPHPPQDCSATSPNDRLGIKDKASDISTSVHVTCFPQFLVIQVPTLYFCIIVVLIQVLLNDFNLLLRRNNLPNQPL